LPGGHDPKVAAYAGGIDLLFPLDRLLRQTQDNLDAGFPAIKMKVGRDRLSEGNYHLNVAHTSGGSGSV